MNDLPDLTEWVRAGTDAMRMMKTLIDVMPAGEDRNAAQQKLDEASDSLALSEAQLAKALGYKLCQCTFPPQIMLWQEDQEAHICPRPECGHALTPTQVRRSDQGGSWNRARRGR